MSYTMQREDAFAFASAINAETKVNGDELTFRYCPKCHGGQSKEQYKFGINLKTGAFGCLRASCGYKGHFVELCRDFDFPLQLENEEPKKYRKLPQPKKAYEPTETAVKYLEGRRISEAITRRYEVTTQKDNPNILAFPFYDDSSILQFVKYRNTLHKSGDPGSKEWCEKDTRPILFGMNHCKNRGSLVIFEGQIDSLSGAESEIDNPVSVPNGANGFTWVKNCREWVEQFEEIIVFGDNENGKITLVDGICKAFPDKQIKVVRKQDYLGEKDANDILRKFGPEAVKKCIENAEIPKERNVFESFNFYSVPDLTDEEKRPPEFIIDGFLPVGMTFLSGAPKIRKSFFALQLAIAVASGASFFGRNVKQCDVVYLDLEGSKNRISTRAERMSTQIPRNVFITNSIEKKLADGLVEQLQALHRQRPSIRLIIIDTYSRSRGNYRGGSANAYDQDVQFLEPIQRMAIDENIAILFIHHDKKGAGFMSDSFERLSGTMGISGSADCVMNLVSEGRRFEGKATLEVNPRDAAGSEMKLSFDEVYCEWRQLAKTEVDLTMNPLCKWIIENVPERQKEGRFISYQDLHLAAYRIYSANPSDLIRDELAEHREELFTQYGIGLQMGVKSNGTRGIRMINLL